MEHSDAKYYTNDKYIYFNAKITNNDPTKSIDAKYLESRLKPVLGYNCGEYKASVIRFKVPASSIPLFIFQDNTYTVSLIDTSGVTHTETLTWINNNNNTDTQNFVFSYNEWADSVNAGLLAAYNDIKVGQPTSPPFVLFNSETQLYSVYATDEYNSTPNQIGKTQIWFNAPTFAKFEFLDAYYNDNGPLTDIFANVLIKQLGTNKITADTTPTSTSKLNTAPAINTIVYYEQTQQQKALYLLSDLDSIAIGSNTIPVNAEQFSSPQDGTSSQVQLNILTDFQPNLDNSITERGYLIYQPNIYRYFDMPGCTNITTLDLVFYWRDIRGTYRLIKVYYNKTIDCKILFEKKRSHVVIDKNLDKNLA